MQYVMKFLCKEKELENRSYLTVPLFYFFRQKKRWSYPGQFVCLGDINTESLGGFGTEKCNWLQLSVLL